MKYKVGDKVKVKEDCQYIDDIYGMKKLRGKVVTISKCQKEGNYNDGEYYYKIKEDNGMYDWAKEYFEPIIKSINEVSTNSVESNEFTKEDLKFGDIVTLRNGDKYICINEKIINEKNYKFCIETYNKDFTYGDEITKIPELDIMKVQRIDTTFIGECFNLEDDKTKIRAIETLYERKEILTEKEREYLSGVIRPFRERIRKIEKCYDEHYVRFYIKMLIDEEEVFPMPYFEEDEEIYMGMEKNKEYTLEELGL